MPGSYCKKVYLVPLYTTPPSLFKGRGFGLNQNLTTSMGFYMLVGHASLNQSGTTLTLITIYLNR